MNICATLASFTTTQKATDKSDEWRLPCKLVATMANERRMLEQHRLPLWNNFTASKQQSLANQLGCTNFSLATRGCQRVTDRHDWGFSNWFHRLADWGFYFFPLATKVVRGRLACVQHICNEGKYSEMVTHRSDIFADISSLLASLSIHTQSSITERKWRNRMANNEDHNWRSAPTQLCY